MRKITTLTLASLLLLPASSVLTGCSNDNLDEEFENYATNTETISQGSQDSRCIEKIVPQKVIEKAMEVYSQGTTGPQTITTVNQLAVVTSINSARPTNGPISVTNATLNNEEITLITLGGTENKKGQATGNKESGLASRGKSNDYLRAVVKLFEDKVIPQDKPIIVTGISLGGMIAQQVIGEKLIMDNYNVLAVITFGSPLTMPIERQDVKVVRFADSHDKVPGLGEGSLRSGLLTIGKLSLKNLKKTLKELDDTERIVRTSKYTGMIETHALSYIEDACWSDVDFLGEKPNTNVLVLKEDMKYYPAPRLNN